jgi:aminomethyltransferase
VLACGAHIGKVTSGSYCPFVEKAVALALVGSGADTTEIGVDVRGKVRAARVTSLPFYVSPARR